jgi:hypothetical protein
MKKKVILLILLTVMIVGTSNGEQFNYTWKDAEGVLNITDYPPPDGIEIIDISVIRLSNKKQAAPVVKKQNKQQNQSATQNVQLAASLRKEEAGLRQKATNLDDEAQELLRIGNRQRHKRSWRYRANIKENEAEELIRQAESLARKAEALERQDS